MLTVLLFLALNVHETQHSFYHSHDPWQHYRSEARWRVLVTPDAMILHDTLGRQERWYTPASVLGSLRYGPYLFERWIDSVGRARTTTTTDTLIGTTYEVDQAVATIFRDRGNGRVVKIETIEHDDFYGDVHAAYAYSDMRSINGIDVPHRIVTSEFGGRIHDTITVLSATDPVAKGPARTMTSSIRLEHYSPRLHGVCVERSDSRSMIVEFKDHLLVYGAPLNPELGEGVHQEITRAFPHKPVKYFAYGHFHNWYTGGMRPFLQQGATLLGPSQSSEFVRHIATAPHTLCPDDQETAPRPLQQRTFTDSITLRDETTEVRFYTIGAQSKHTSDYTLMYLPKDRILVVDDLVWIKRNGPLQAADERQRSLYQAITSLSIDVNTIMITWPLERRGLKKEVSFDEFERSVKITPTSN